jgi:hypothetical protein
MNYWRLELKYTSFPTEKIITDWYDSSERFTTLIDLYKYFKGLSRDTLPKIDVASRRIEGLDGLVHVHGRVFFMQEDEANEEDFKELLDSI